MNGHMPEHEERRYAERFDRGEREGANPNEQETFDSYLRIQNALRAYPAPDVDPAPLAKTMQDAMTRRSRWLPSLPFPIPKPAFAAAAACLFITIYLFSGLFGNNASAVKQVMFTQTSSTETILPSRYWSWRLKRGNPVDVPPDMNATITLADGSTVECSPDAAIAVAFGDMREIRLDNGSITVHAAKNEDLPMVVKTPLGMVRVTGTVFVVEVVR